MAEDLFYIKRITDKDTLKAVFYRMGSEGLSNCVIYAHKEPTVEMWLEWTDPSKVYTLGVYNNLGALLAVGTFTPWRYKAYEFDFTVFRAYFDGAVDYAKAGFAWIFEHTDCQSIIGMCPRPNRHAWNLAKACGFTVMGTVKDACFYAKKNKCVDAVMVSIDKD